METAGSNWLNPMTGDGFGLPRNAVSGHRYQGINVLILGFTGSYWATYKQWQGKGCQVRKGEKGTSIVLFKKIEIKDKATGDKKMIPMLKTFSVFSANQVDGEFADKDQQERPQER
jgi:antirestriction protein ArdC